MKTTRRVPMGPTTLWSVAASTATAKAMNANSGHSSQKLFPTLGYAPRNRSDDQVDH